MIELLKNHKLGLPYGDLVISDQGFYVENVEFTEEHMEQGFLCTEHAARYLTSYDIASATLTVIESQGSVTADASRTVSFPIQVSSGTLLIGDGEEGHHGCIELDVKPGSYQVTIVQRNISEEGIRPEIEVVVYLGQLNRKEKTCE